MYFLNLKFFKYSGYFISRKRKGIINMLFDFIQFIIKNSKHPESITFSYAPHLLGT